MHSSTNFFLGRWESDQQPVHYDPADLTTHGVLIGMTGSGKTGLLITALEEAARQGLPAIIIDPKGDLANLLLHFPDLAPADFAPWVDPEAARRQGISPDVLAQATAEKWRAGLAGWGLGRDDLLALRELVDYALYTPGSRAGAMVNLLSSFAAPPDWQVNPEVNRERIASTVTALLGLVGVDDADPLRSREHILLANIFESSWSQGLSLDLHELIEQVQSPPFDQLGAFPLERFFPEKDRFELALLLNNFLAAPSFQTWLEGQPLDVETLLYQPTADGQRRSRFCIFYLAHLSETERMFFVTLLLAAVESWMRSQRGTSGLRALLAFDEIVGYLPPVANPPSRPVLLRLLKQARAFGLGLLLSTQNPTDLNYKALSNAGTWFIGRLQTERDRDRLLDGLQALESAIDRAAFERLITGLKPRQFLLHNIHQDGARVFESRWALNYLAGPLTRTQLSGLKTAQENPPAGVGGPSRVPVSAGAPVSASAPPARKNQIAAGQSSRPVLPPGAHEFFLPALLNLQRALASVGGAFQGPLEPLGMVYKPALLAQGKIRYLARRFDLDYSHQVACLLSDADGRPDWQALIRPPFDLDLLDGQPIPQTHYQPLPHAWASARGLAVYKKDFLDWIYHSAALSLPANEALKVYGRPTESETDFRERVNLAMRAAAQSEIDRLSTGYESRLEAIKRKIQRQQEVVNRRENLLDDRQAEQRAADFEFVAGLFTGRKRKTSSSRSKRRLAQQAREERDESRQLLDTLQAELKDVATQQKEALSQIRAAWQERATQVSQVTVTPLKKDIFLETFGVAWMPYFQVQARDGVIEAPAF